MELAGKMGPPILAGTLVACLLSGVLGVDHLALMVLGFGLTWLGHWGTQDPGKE